MRVEDAVRIRHMIEAAESIIEFVAGRERSELDTNRMLLFAVVRAIEILGEAASKVTDEARAANSAIPWKAIIGMRNRLIHAYFDGLNGPGRRAESEEEVGETLRTH